MDKKPIDLRVIINQKKYEAGIEDGMKWTPADAFQWMQDNPNRQGRQITRMVVCYELDDGTNGYLSAGCSRLEGMGLLALTKKEF